MLSITKRYNKFKGSTHFTKLKTNGRFAIYAPGTYLTATFLIAYLRSIIEFPLLPLPFTVLISHPVIQVVTGVVFTVTCKMISRLYTA